jgi:hypothetical protein
MVTYEQLREHLGRRPFHPFRCVLKNGRHLDVVRPNQVATLKRRLYSGQGSNLPMWIWLEEMERVELIEAQPA